MHSVGRRGEVGAAVTPAGGERPVVLATLGVPFAAPAVTFAVGAALESGQPLIVANVVELPPLAMSVNMRHDQLDDPPELEAALAAPARTAWSLGVQVQRLRVRSMRPVPALVELAETCDAGLLVFGPDPARLRRRALRRAAARLRADVGCLLWIVGDYEDER
ncbi:MAG TPA: universal stress protein [Gaiellaceae bacterium]